MKIRITILMMLLPFFMYAQPKKRKHKTVKTENRLSAAEFFATQQLSLDSVNAPYLYYDVYDWLGTKYKYSGDSKKGIDCSGFVSRIYKDAYCVCLSGGSRDIWKIVTPVEKEALKEGDVLFFRIKKGQISHVGIYLGNNKFAHASVKSGVIISDLNEDYYKKYFYKGGRVVGLLVN
jgi:lipoprotein Spr